MLDNIDISKIEKKCHNLRKLIVYRVYTEDWKWNVLMIDWYPRDFPNVFGFSSRSLLSAMLIVLAKQVLNSHWADRHHGHLSKLQSLQQVSKVISKPFVVCIYWISRIISEKYKDFSADFSTSKMLKVLSVLSLMLYACWPSTATGKDVPFSGNPSKFYQS